MANPSLQIGNGNWAIKEDDLLGYSKAGTRFVPEPITMTRASAGTRVNPEGLVETVGSLGSELITNGNFSEIGPEEVTNGDFSQIGSEQVTNGDFATDSNWSKGTGWSIANGKATHAGGSSNTYINQLNTTTVGKVYKAVFTLSGGLNATNYIQTYGSSAYPDFSNQYTSAGTYTLYFTADATFFRFRAVSPDNDVSVDNVSIKEVGQDWSLGTGWSVEDNQLVSVAGTAAYTTQASVGEIGKTYQVTVDVDEVSAGQTYAYTGVGGTWYTITSPGVYTFYVVWDSSTSFGIYKNSTFAGKWNSISIKEVGQDWTFGDNWTIDQANSKATSDGSQTGNVSLKQLNSTNNLVTGKTYKVQYTISEWTAGAINPHLRGTAIGNVSGNGPQVVYGTAGAGSDGLNLYAGSTFSGSISNVSVKEATVFDLARVDYTDGTSSLLVEPQRTNLLTYSEDFSNAIYIKDSTVSVGTTNNVSPSGESNATKIDVTASGRIYSNLTTDTYVSSIFIKAGTFAYFKLAGVQVDLVAETNANGTIESLGNGWFKVGVNYTGSRPFQIQAYPDGTYSPHTTTGDYYIWGSQIEQASYATSYIPTSGGAVTRLQDQYEKTGISDLINSEEGVLFIEMAALQTTNTNSEYLAISDGTYTENSIMFQLRNGANQLAVWSYSGGVNQTAKILTLTDITDFNKIAIKWKVNDFEVFVNGSSVYSLGTYTAPTGLDRIEFSRNGSANFYGKVKQLQIYKTALSDDELTILTGTSGVHFYPSYAAMASVLTYTIE